MATDQFVAAAIGLLLIVTCSASLWTWWRVCLAASPGSVHRFWLATPRLPERLRPAPQRSFETGLAITLTVLWVGWMLGQRVWLELAGRSLAGNALKVTLADVVASLGVSLFLWVLVASLWFSTSRPASERSQDSAPDENREREFEERERAPGTISSGWTGFLLAVGPMLVTALATSPLRNTETRHQFLNLLTDEGGWQTWLVIGVSAVVVAPLLEELLFRCVLQGWLLKWLPTVPAIVLVAICFCVSHGPIDGLALVPIAVILGVMAASRRQYLAHVLVHGLFNGYMLLLAWLFSLVQSPVADR